MKELEKLKVGDYVRTTKKGIFKIISIENTPYGYKVGRSDNENIAVFTIGKGGHSEIKNDIVDFSSNILDLIEVGDYVNGEEVVTIYGYDEDGNDKDDKGIIEVDDDYAYGVYLEDINIYSIITKEQFENIEYRLEK